MLAEEDLARLPYYRNVPGMQYEGTSSLPDTRQRKLGEIGITRNVFAEEPFKFGKESKESKEAEESEEY